MSPIAKSWVNVLFAVCQFLTILRAIVELAPANEIATSMSTLTGRYGPVLLPRATLLIGERTGRGGRPSWVNAPPFPFSWGPP